MDQIFARLQKNKKTDVGSLMNWIKDSKVIDDSQEDKVRGFFNDIKDKSNVTLQQFKEVLNKLAAETKKSFFDITKQLGENLNFGEIAKQVGREGFNALRDAIGGGASSGSDQPAQDNATGSSDSK